ncbi:MAG: hypothetical protein H6553_07990 [Chitinophagales bacterium]|nr:hypothetical protein [Chitinophagales bacterium]
MLLLFVIVSTSIIAQDIYSYDTNNEETYYRKSWRVGGFLQSNGIGFGATLTNGKQKRSALLYQFDWAYFFHSNEKKRNSRYTPGDLVKKYYYGKINSLMAIHAAVGQEIILANKAEKNGVMISFSYAGGFTLGILKPYELTICTDITNSTCTDFAYMSYDEAGADFLNPDLIIGSAGFGKGWQLKFRPGLHLKTGISFDWGKASSLIKVIDVGAACDFYFKDLPIMIDNNKAFYPSVYLGFSLGKRK